MVEETAMPSHHPDATQIFHEDNEAVPKIGEESQTPLKVWAILLS